MDNKNILLSISNNNGINLSLPIELVDFDDDCFNIDDVVGSAKDEECVATFFLTLFGAFVETWLSTTVPSFSVVEKRSLAADVILALCSFNSSKIFFDPITPFLNDSDALRSMSEIALTIIPGVNTVLSSLSLLGIIFPFCSSSSTSSSSSSSLSS
ncbi:hypothetical protein DERF_014910 [Dermatophagoides farinae]|uniref:Uncharacterized protein n=1 Tax=Dermatophagoides farinae TaxID=6954 RepID=A0A922HND0_DERFA|nr:hypothetical protein DERF_014910 [Dermatophagoides farinae]